MFWATLRFKNMLLLMLAINFPHGHRSHVTAFHSPPPNLLRSLNPPVSERSSNMAHVKKKELSYTFSLSVDDEYLLTLQKKILSSSLLILSSSSFCLFFRFIAYFQVTLIFCWPCFFFLLEFPFLLKQESENRS